MGEHEPIVIVEDNAHVRTAMGMLAGMYGHTIVASATSVGEARSIIDNPDVSFRVAIVDGNLPDGHGHEVASYMRKVRPEVTVFGNSTEAQTYGDQNFLKGTQVRELFNAITNI